MTCPSEDGFAGIADPPGPHVPPATTPTTGSREDTNGPGIPDSAKVKDVELNYFNFTTISNPDDPLFEDEQQVGKT